jgi:hypothetical protein
MTGDLEFSASATVTMKLKFTGKGHWGAKASIEEVSRLGGRETLNVIMTMIDEMRRLGVDVEIIGSPEHGVVVNTRAKP